MPTTLRFSNQGPVVLGLGGAYPSYASIPTVFGGPGNSYLISLYNRGGTYVPNNQYNTLIPTTIGPSNPVDWSDYYTSTNYTTGDVPPIPNPRPGNNERAIIISNPVTPYQAYIGDTYNFGSVEVKGFDIQIPITCSSVIINGQTVSNIATNQSQIQFIVTAEMNYDIMNPADVTLNTNYSYDPVIPKYFTRFPIDSTQATITATEGIAGAIIGIAGLRSLQDSPAPTITIGGVPQTIDTVMPNSVSFTVNAMTPRVLSNIVITNQVGDSTTLPMQFKRITNAFPISPTDRGPPPNINWQAQDSIPETITVVVSNNFTPEPVGTGPFPYIVEQVSSANNTDPTINFGKTISLTSTGELIAGGIPSGYPGIASTSRAGEAYGAPATGSLGTFTMPAVGGSYSTGTWKIRSAEEDDLFFRTSGTNFGYIIKTNPSNYNSWQSLGFTVLGVTNAGSTQLVLISGNINAWIAAFSGAFNEASPSSTGDFNDGYGRITGYQLDFSQATQFRIRTTAWAVKTGDTIYIRNNFITSVSSFTTRSGSFISSASPFPWEPIPAYIGNNTYLFSYRVYNIGFSFNDTTYRLQSVNTSGVVGSQLFSIVMNGTGAVVWDSSATGQAQNGVTRQISNGLVTYSDNFGVFTINPTTLALTNNFFRGNDANNRAAFGAPGNVYLISNAGAGQVGYVFAAGGWNQGGGSVSNNFVPALMNTAPSSSGQNNRLLSLANNVVLYNGVYLNSVTVNGITSAGGTNNWYCYFTAIPVGSSTTNQYRFKFGTSADGTTIMTPSPTSYNITRPANVKYNWSAFSVSYTPTTGMTPTQIANGINSLLLTNWGGSVTPTTNVALDVNGNAILTFNTNIVAESNTQVSQIVAPQSGSITLSASGGTIGNDITRIPVTSAVGPIYIENGYGYVYNGTSYLTFSHDGAGFDANSAIVTNSFRPTNIRELYNF